jgi:hypothetical protein
MEYIMKLDPKTTHILSNFSSINSSILFKEGNVIATVSPTKTVLAKASIPNNFPKRFAIYNLSRFLSTVSLMTEPELSFGDSSVNISSEDVSVEYRYAEETTIKVPPEKDIVLPSVDVEFKFVDKTFKEVIRAAGVLQLPEFAVVGENGNIYLQALDSKNPSCDVYRVKVGETDKSFRIIFKVDNVVKLMAGDYDVKISSKGISHFKGADIEYWIAVETSSSYGG